MSKPELYQKIGLILFISGMSFCTYPTKDISAKCERKDVILEKYGSLATFTTKINIPSCNIPAANYKLIFDIGSTFTFLDKGICNSNELPHESLLISTVSAEKTTTMYYATAYMSENDIFSKDFKLYFTEITNIFSVDGIAGNHLFENQLLLIDFPEKFSILADRNCLNLIFHPFIVIAGQILLPVVINGVRKEMILDSGSSLSFLENVSANECAAKKDEKFSDLSGISVEGWKCKFSKICVYENCLDNLDFITSLMLKNNSSGSLPKYKEGILGVNFMKYFYIIIDYKNNQIAFSRK